nr:MAG: major capsid protein [Microviridae sp.]
MNKNKRVTLGGDRLGAGKKNTVELEDFGYSEHDLGNVFRSTMSAGTLVPFMVQVGLPGDHWKIKLNADCKTLPTVAPVFGSFKIQLDVFVIPARLYNSWIHNNKLGIGMNMGSVTNPVYTLTTINESNAWSASNPAVYPINNSHILKYLGVSGIGRVIEGGSSWMQRDFNAIPLLGYWDIFKNYYANKQEDFGYVLTPLITTPSITSVAAGVPGNVNNLTTTEWSPTIGQANEISIVPTDDDSIWNWQQIINTVVIKDFTTGAIVDCVANLLQGTPIYVGKYVYPAAPTVIPNASTWYIWEQTGGGYSNALICYGLSKYTKNYKLWTTQPSSNYGQAPSITPFPLANIDEIREAILGTAGNTQFNVNNWGYSNTNRLIEGVLPQKTLTTLTDAETATIYTRYSQGGLLLKTYQSDLFNNWLNEETFTGTGGIDDLTNVDVSAGYLSIDSLELGYKIYKMLNQIAVTGGSYDDWQRAVYNHERYAAPEIPIYVGGLSKELVFQEIWSMAGVSSAGGSNPNQPLGTLSGKGSLGMKHKGGEIDITINEPSYIMGIVSLTPRLDYSQGNDFHTELYSWDDYHKPHLDQVGFEDLMAERLAWFGTYNNGSGWQGNAVGKQPAWINYMTNYNRDFGLFAESNNLMCMVVNRRYTMGQDPTTAPIKDLTTYIEPNLYNYLFAYTALDSQNFWMQILNESTVRRKMSAKIMPNL